MVLPYSRIPAPRSVTWDECRFDPVDEDVEFGVDATHVRKRGPGRGQIAERTFPAAIAHGIGVAAAGQPVGGAAGGDAQTVGVAKSLAVGFQPGLLVHRRGCRLDLLKFEAVQVQVSLPGPVAVDPS